jgi:hypothetical protein
MARLMHVAGLALLGAVLVVGPVSAAAPQTERIPIDDTFVDDFLSAACETEVTVHETGHIALRTWTDAAGNQVRALNTYALTDTFSSVNGSVAAKNVGPDRISFLDNGNIIILTIGNIGSISIPGQGRVYQNVGRSMIVVTFDADGNATVEVTPLAGQHDSEATQVEAICGVLGG